MFTGANPSRHWYSKKVILTVLTVRVPSQQTALLTQTTVKVAPFHFYHHHYPPIPVHFAHCISIL